MWNLLYTLVQVAYDLFLKLNPRKVGAHAAIFDGDGRVLLLRSRYADAWMLPGGGLNRREHVDEGVRRECREELGVDITIETLTGLYYHERSSAYVAVFRCRLAEKPLRLSHEHGEHRWVAVDEVPAALRPMVADAVGPIREVAIKRI